MSNMNNFAVSFGLIVKTNDNKVVIIQRKVPYSVQNYIVENKYFFNISNYKKSFFISYLKGLNFQTKLDYLKFHNNFPFEDQFDFPHGQMKYTDVFNKCTVTKQAIDKLKKSSIVQLNKNMKYYAFMTAFREFEEETGYTFNLKENIEDVPFDKVEFVGLDGFSYKQIYFSITVDKLVQNVNLKLEGFYDTLLVDVSVAEKIFKNQQCVKKDDKHKLL